MKGTSWVEPGLGASIGALWEAVANTFSGSEGAPTDLMNSLHSKVSRHGSKARTNLVLTGGNLDKNDLGRIERVEIRGKA